MNLGISRRFLPWMVFIPQFFSNKIKTFAFQVERATSDTTSGNYRPLVHHTLLISEQGGLHTLVAALLMGEIC